MRMIYVIAIGLPVRNTVVSRVTGDEQFMLIRADGACLHVVGAEITLKSLSPIRSPTT